MEKRYALKVTFFKEKQAVYFSQLDIYRLLMRALRRSNLAVFYTSGFNPHPKFSLGDGLKVGKEGNIWAKFYLEEEILPSQFQDKLEKQIPPDLKIIAVETV